MAEVDERTDEDSGALRRGNARERFQKLGDVVRVAGAFAGIARRANARCTVQCIDDDPRVVGNRGQPGCSTGGARLDERILDEREAGLLRRLDAERILRDDAQSGRLQ